MNFGPAKRHTDENVIKILGKKYYIWFITDNAKQYGKPDAIVTDHLLGLLSIQNQRYFVKPHTIFHFYITLLNPQYVRIILHFRHCVK